jgi:phage terminase Nu1 subunit (DNA packaging protein)
MSTRPKQPRKQACGKAPTLAEIAKALEVSTRRVSQLRAGGMPVDSIDAAIHWRKSQHDDDSAAELRRRRIALLKAQERIAKGKADEQDGLTVSRAECKEAWIQIATAIAAMLTAMEREIPQLCLGLPLSQSLPKVKEKMREIRAIFADGESEFWASHPEKNTDTTTKKP